MVTEPPWAGMRERARVDQDHGRTGTPLRSHLHDLTKVRHRLLRHWLDTGHSACGSLVSPSAAFVAASVELSRALWCNTSSSTLRSSLALALALALAFATARLRSRLGRLVGTAGMHVLAAAVSARRHPPTECLAGWTFRFAFALALTLAFALEQHVHLHGRRVGHLQGTIATEGSTSLQEGHQPCPQQLVVA